MPNRRAAWLAPLLAAASPLALATENGTATFPRGGDDFLIAAMPPPGNYAIFYANHYSAEHVQVSAFTPRVDWIKPVEWLGADRWGTLVAVPYLDIDLSLSPTLGEHRAGLGDFTLGNGLHWTIGSFQTVMAFDVIAPTGRYDASHLVNTSRNTWGARLSHMGTWLEGPWDISYRIHYDYETKNRDTGYHSGGSVYFSYALDRAVTPSTRIGVIGYAGRQVVDDTGPGAPPDGNRLRANGFGAAILQVLPNGWAVTAKVFHESSATNGPRGNHAWVYVGGPLGNSR
jgi:hypothetical protein